MRATFSLVPPYLQTDGKTKGVGGLPWFSEYGFQQTRGFRALKVWMALRYHGLSGYRSSIERDIRLAGPLAGLLRGSGDIEIFEPQVSASCVSATSRLYFARTRRRSIV
jgi:aromatic-L-amino-acid decarboxylase